MLDFDDCLIFDSVCLMSNRLFIVLKIISFIDFQKILFSVSSENTFLTTRLIIRRQRRNQDLRKYQAHIDILLQTGGTFSCGSPFPETYLNADRWHGREGGFQTVAPRFGETGLSERDIHWFTIDMWARHVDLWPYLRPRNGSHSRKFHERHGKNGTVNWYALFGRAIILLSVLVIKRKGAKIRFRNAAAALLGNTATIISTFSIIATKFVRRAGKD